MKIIKNLSLANSEIMALIVSDVNNDIDSLTAEEKLIWDKKKFKRQRLDWLSARVAAKVCCSEWFKQMYNKEIPIKNIAITNSFLGVPQINWPLSIIPPHLSLSHKNGIGLAVISDTSFIGCDIELVKNRHPKFRTYFLTPQEVDVWFNNNVNYNCNLYSSYIETLLWSAKESVLKALTSRYNDNNFSFTDISINFIDKNEFSLGFETSYCNGTIMYLCLNPYVVTIASIIT